MKHAPNPLNILYVSHSHPPKNSPMENIGGMQTVSIQLLEQFKRHSSVNVAEYVQYAPWKTIHARTARFLLGALRRLPGIIRTSRPDAVVFTSMVTASLAPLLRARGVRTPLLAINHGHDVTMPFGPYQRHLRRVFKALDAVVSVSKATRQASLDRGADPSKAVVIPNGIEMLFSDGLPDRPMAQEVFWMNIGPVLSMQRKGRPARPMLLTVGRLVPRKGHAWFMEHVLPRIGEPLDYIVIGEGPEMGRLKELAARIGPQIPHQIHLLGRQGDETMRMAYAGSDLFIMPNIPVPGDMEGFGVVLLEANLARTPVVASDLEGIRDVIRNGVNGFRVPALDDEAFAKRIESMLEHRTSGGLASFGRQAARHVMDTYSWEAVSELYVARLRTLSSSV